VIASLAGQGFDVQHACLMLGVSVSGYYDWKERPPSQRTLRHAWLAGEIAQVHKDSAGTYGKLRITAPSSDTAVASTSARNRLGWS
jgi:putative transposase